MTEREIAHATFTLERHYGCSPDRVFAAWAEPETKSRWFARGAPGYQLDFRVGGIERNTGEHEGTTMTWEALYREILADRRIVYTAVLMQDEVVATVSQTTVDLVAEADGTHLVLTEQGAYLDGHELPEWREQGTGDWLDALGRDLADQPARR